MRDGRRGFFNLYISKKCEMDVGGFLIYIQIQKVRDGRRGFLIYIRKLILASITREGQNQLHPLPWLILGFFELCFLCQSHRAVGILNDF